MDDNEQLLDDFCSESIKLMDAGKPEKAIPYLDKAIELNPNDIYLHIRKSTCLFRLGKHEEELICYEEALKVAKTDEEISDVVFERVQALEKLKRYDEALEDYNKLLELGNVFPYFIWSSREALLFDAGRYQDGIELKINEADKFFRQGQYDRAIFWYDVAESALQDIKDEYATDLFQKHAELYLKRSKTKQYWGDEKGAREDMEIYKQNTQQK